MKKKKKSEEVPLKSLLDRVKEIEENLLVGTSKDRYFFLALKSLLPDQDKGMMEIKKLRDTVLLVSRALGFEYEDVTEEISRYHLRKIACDILFKEIKNEEKATTAILSGGKTIEAGYNMLKLYGELRHPKVAHVLQEQFDQELDEFPF